MFKKLVLSTLISVSSVLVVPVAQASVVLNVERAIIAPGDSSVSISLDGDKSKSFLVQSWVSDLKDQEASMFTTMPQLALVAPNKSQSLKVLYQGTGLPQDRESRFLLNIQAVPGQDQSEGARNSLTPSIVQTISLFYRPKNLSGMASEDAPKQLQWTLAQQSPDKYAFIAKNPTPFYVNIVNAFIANRGEKSSSIFGYATQLGYLAPFSEKMIEVPKKSVGSLAGGEAQRQVWFVTKNDAGFSVAYHADLSKQGVGVFTKFVPKASTSKTHSATPKNMGTEGPNKIQP